MKNILSLTKLKLTLVIIIFSLSLSMARINKSYACESAAAAAANVSNIISTSSDDINNWGKQLRNFVTLVSETVEWMIKKRLEEFDKNTRAWLSDWWLEKYLPALKDQTTEMAISQITQTMEIGKMIDEMMLSEVMAHKQKRELESARRYKPSTLFCQTDSLGPSEGKTYEISREINAGFTEDDMPRRSNRLGTAAAAGEFQDINEIFDEYVNNFCDHTKGDQGCDSVTPGVLSDKHKDMSGLLWGDKQTIDMVDPKNRLLVNAAMRYLIYLGSVDPVPPRIVTSSDGKREILSRRAEMARSNTIYNVIGQIIGERVGVDGAANTKKIRMQAGISDADASDKPSYREIQEALNRDKFIDKTYTMKLIASPEENAREQISIGAARLQLMEDTYHRMEELLFMMSADYSRDLDKRRPPSAFSSIKLNH